MDKIKIEEILLKTINEKMGGKPFENIEEAWQWLWMIYDPSPAKRLVKAAIKEIVELVVDKCAEEAKTKWKYKEHLGDIKIVDKDSILKVKEEISYE